MSLKNAAALDIFKPRAQKIVFVLYHFCNLIVSTVRKSETMREDLKHIFFCARARSFTL